MPLRATCPRNDTADKFVRNKMGVIRPRKGATLNRAADRANSPLRAQASLDTSTQKSDFSEGTAGVLTPAAPQPFDPKHIRHIVAKFQTGVEPEENFRHLFEHYYHRVYGFFAKRGLKPEQCEDLTQETFLRVFQNLERFRHRSGFETWLFVITGNIYRDRLRESYAQKRSAAEIPLQSLTETSNGGSGEGRFEPRSTAPDAFDRFLKKERLRLMRLVIEKLPERIRHCLILHFYHGLSYQDVAKALRLPLGSVKAHLHEGKKKLRRRIRRNLTKPGVGRKRPVSVRAEKEQAAWHGRGWV